MRFEETPLAGVYLAEAEPHRDERGSLGRAYCDDEFAAHGLTPVAAQANLSHSHRRGTLRGLHYQVDPATEAKLVRCIRGSLFDVVVDLRPDSATYGQWHGVRLEDPGSALYVPEMCAHGFLTLADDTLAFYQVSRPYTPGAERGLRFDDPVLGIDWPIEPTVLSDKDRSWPLLESS